MGKKIGPEFDYSNTIPKIDQGDHFQKYNFNLFYGVLGGKDNTLFFLSSKYY